MDLPILVVEDDPHIADLVKLTLEHAGYPVIRVADGHTALEVFSSTPVRLVVLDLMLPGMDGEEVCRRLRREGNIPIVMVTGRGAEKERVRGLEMGADDYIVKPFSPRELVARVRSVLRRTGEPAPPQLEFPALVIDLGARRVEARKQAVQLTPKEFDLLMVLAQRPGKVLTREALVQQVWGYNTGAVGRTVDEHIRRLRMKIEAQTRPYQYIQTVWGVGYKFEVTV